MTSKSIKNRISNFETGKVFRLEDLGLPRSEQNAAVVTLGRLVQEGEIERLSRGTYYKPKRTRFGVVGPSMEERFRDLLYDNNTPIGYLTGFYAFNLFGLTTQQLSTLEIGSNFPKRNGKRGMYTIRFVLQKNPINRDNIEMLRITPLIGKERLLMMLHLSSHAWIIMVKQLLNGLYFQLTV